MSNSQLSDTDLFPAGKPFRVPARQRPRRAAPQNGSETGAASKARTAQPASPDRPAAKRQKAASRPKAAATRERRGIELTRSTTSALVSLIVHTVLFVILLSLAVGVGGGTALTLQIESGAAALEEGLEELDVSLDLPATASNSLQPVTEQTTAPASPASASNMTLKPEATVAEVGMGPPAPTVANSEIEFLGSGDVTSLLAPVGPMFSGHSLDGRSPGNRAALAAANGGSRETEAAV